MKQITDISGAMLANPMLILVAIGALAVLAFLVRDVLRPVGRSFLVFFKNPVPVVVLAGLVALPGAWLHFLGLDLFSHMVEDWLPARGTFLDPQRASIYALVASDLLVLVWTCLAGPIAAAGIIRVYQQHEAGERAGAMDALAWAVSRWRRLVVPYILATLAIFVGFVVVIPGILYSIFYAFVPPVAVLDHKVKRVLSRSSRLTRGRRGRIFRVFMTFLPWWGWYGTVGPFILLSVDRIWTYGAAMVNGCIGLVVAMTFLQLYLDRMEEIEAMIAARETGGSPTE